MYLEAILLLLHFTPTVVASLKIRMRLILKKLFPLSAPFQHFRFRVRFRFQPLSSKCFCFGFHKKINRFHRFRFQLPLPLPHSWFLSMVSHYYSRLRRYHQQIILGGYKLSLKDRCYKVKIVTFLELTFAQLRILLALFQNQGR